jgi:RNA polymerase sigma-70 factor (ECF subfamily)
MSSTQTIDDARLEEYRTELTGYSYRMLGSAFEAEDAVQETLIRAWKALDGFDNRSSLRTWLYRIATNVCLDMLKGRKRRALPIDLSPASTASAPLAEPLPDNTWVEPIPDGRVLPLSGDPSELAELRESIRLAFVAALQHLPPRQRAVLILRDVLSWSAGEVAQLLEVSVASANSVLQRARTTLQSKDLATTPPEPITETQNVLLTKYVDAFERYDIDSFVSLLHEEFTQAMPPYPMWLEGPREAATWMLGPGIACRGSILLPINVNACPGFGQYRPSGPGGRHEPWAIHLVEIEGDRVARITYFLDTNLFPLFGLPPHPGG